MQTLIPRTTMAAFLVLTLSACGGGGGGGDGDGVSSTPDASTGFAQAGDTLESTVTFTSRNNPRVSNSGSGPSLSTETISIVFRSGTVLSVPLDLAQMRITLDGTTSDLGFAVASASGVDYGAGDATFTFTGESDNEAVYAGYFEIDPDGSSNYDMGHIVFGYDTDPATIANLTSGGATYNGSISVAGYQGTTISTATGDFDLIANFLDDEVNGSFDLSTLSDLISSEDYTLELTSISGNSFEGDITLDDGTYNGGQVLDNGTYQGQFYGVDGDAVGGTIFATITGDADGTIFLEGAFVADD